MIYSTGFLITKTYQLILRYAVFIKVFAGGKLHCLLSIL